MTGTSTGGHGQRPHLSPGDQVAAENKSLAEYFDWFRVSMSPDGHDFKTCVPKASRSLTFTQDRLGEVTGLLRED